MSYYVGDEEDDIYQPPRTSRSRSSRRSSRSLKSKSKSKIDLVEQTRSGGADEEHGASPNDKSVECNSPSSEDRRRDRRLQAKRDERQSRSRERKLRAKYGTDGRNQRIVVSKQKKSKGKSRQDRIYDDLYGTEYHEVDDGIVGCADDLCVNKNDFVEDDDLKVIANKDASPNIGEQNKVDDNEEVYIVRQRYGYFSILFGVAQVIVLALMMWQCGIAPMNINPMFGPYPDALSEWGGKNSILIVEDGEWWRLLTPIFLHAGLIHLLCNVAVQLELGVFFEREWGSMTWLIIYMSSALGSSVLSVITMPDAVSVGSSGAVMGLFGGKLAEIICRSCEKSDTAQDRVAHQVRKEQCVGVTCSVLVVLAFSFIPYVDWAAHLGGLLAGFAVGFMTFSVHMESYCLRLLWFLIGMALTLGFLIPCIEIMYSGDIPMNEELRDVCGYYTQNFEDYECNCMREEYMANLKNNFFNKNGGNAYGDDDGGGERYLYESSTYHDGYY